MISLFNFKFSKLKALDLAKISSPVSKLMMTREDVANIDNNENINRYTIILTISNKTTTIR